MITGIHEKFDNRTIVILSTTTTNLPTLLPWISSILTLFPYRPLCITNDTRFASGSTSGNSVQSGKYSKLFTPTRDTNTTSNDSFDPSTIMSTQTPRGNVWSNTFDCQACAVTMNTDPTRTHRQLYHQTTNGPSHFEIRPFALQDDQF
jgi:hypothetical protein